MGATPDFVQAVLGYRGWVVRDGLLAAVAIPGADPWQPGVTTAVCALERPSKRHRAPVSSCTCGLYALFDRRDHRLDRHDLVVGAIAAWGALEVAVTGFRAEHACVTAIVDDPRCSSDQRLLRASIAERYGAALVAPADLESAALEHASPLPASAIPAAPPSEPRRPPKPATRRSPIAAPASVRRARRRRPAAAPQPPRATEHAYVADHQLWLRGDPRSLEVGLLDGLASDLGTGVTLTVPPIGTVLQRGDLLLAIDAPNGPGALVVPAPITLAITAVHPKLVTDPDALLAPGTAELTALFSCSPFDLQSQRSLLLWERSGALEARAVMRDARDRGEDPWAELRQLPVVASAPRGWAQIRDALRERRARARFADSDAIRAFAQERLADHLGRDEALAVQLAQARLHARLEVRDPACAIDIDLGGEQATITVGESDGTTSGSALVLRLCADTLAAVLDRETDGAAAINRGDIEVQGEPAQAFVLLSILSRFLATPDEIRRRSGARR